jgi:hypothetical protein
MQIHLFPLAKYKTPSQFLNEMRHLGINHYLYTIAYGHKILKDGRGTTDRVARQVEGLEGWGRHYAGWAAVEIRDGLKDAGIRLNRNDVVIQVYDYTTEWTAWATSLGKKTADDELDNKERALIMGRQTRSPLNKHVLKKQKLTSTLYDHFFDDVVDNE